MYEFWGLVGCEAWETLLAIAVWRFAQVKARDLWFVLGERGAKSTPIRVLGYAPLCSSSCPRTQSIGGGTTSLPRVRGWSRWSRMLGFGYSLYFDCRGVFGCLVSSGGAWLSAFSRIVAPRVPFCSRQSSPLAGTCLAPSGDA